VQRGEKTRKERETKRKIERKIIKSKKTKVEERGLSLLS